MISSEIEKFYTIEKLDVKKTNKKNITIYIKDTSKVEEVNLYLIQKYNPNKDNSMMVFYFTQKGIGKTYLEKQFDENVSEEDKDRLFKFLFSNYTYNSSNGYEKMNYPHK